MKLQTINTTRQELIKIKKRLKTARAGHKLLKDKLESLMREFLGMIHQLKTLQKEIREEVPLFYFLFFQANSQLSPDWTKKLFLTIPFAKLDKKNLNMMGVRSVEYKATLDSYKIPVLASTYELDEAKEKSKDMLAVLMKYASLERQVRDLVQEIEKTRRRVNALEFIFIPELVNTQKFIFQKLEESDRMSRTILMKLKTMLR